MSIRIVTHRACLGLFLLFCNVAPAQENSYPPPPFVPPAGHPRVYFNTADIPRLREAALHPQNALALAEHKKNLASGIEGKLPEPKDPAAGNMDSRVLAIITSYAYEYAVHGDENSGRLAVSSLHNYLRTVVYPPKDYNNTGQTVFTIGAVYDWCYPLLTAEDRESLYRAAIETAGKMEIGWPPVKQGNVTGHGPEGQLFRDLLVASVAMYDESPEMYRWVAGRFFSRMVETKKFMYPAHMHHQGVHYCNYRGQWEMLATIIFDRLGLPQVFGPDQRYLMYWTLYARRGDGQVLRDGDTHINNRPLGEYWTSPFRTMFLAANYFKDPYLKMEAHRQRPNLEPMQPRQNQACDAVEVLIFNDPNLDPKPLNELPLTKYFPSPKGAMIARTGWEDGIDSSSVVAEMKINEWYFANHQHLDAGAFQIYCRGALAIDSGYYQAGINKTDNPANDGSSGYGSLYDVNYYKRSIAHNVVTVYDPNEKFDTKRWEKFKIANDGGQRMPNRWIEPREHEELIDPNNGYRIAEVLARSSGPDTLRPEYSYLKGDLSRAYSSKISEYERSFAFLNMNDPAHPAVMVVFDRVVSSDPSFRKTWLLHGLEQPEVSGNRFVYKDTRKGYTGKLTVDTLLPEPDDTQINVVGGSADEVNVDGNTYKVALRPDGLNEGGRFRVEVSPRAARHDNYFLHVLQCGDHTPDVEPLEVTKFETPAHAGALFGGKLVVFAKSRNRLGHPLEITVPGTSTAKVLLADLEAGVWTIHQRGRPPFDVVVTEETGVAYFDAPPGKYRITRTK